MHVTFLFALATSPLAYPPRYPQVSPARKQQAGDPIRREDPSLTVEADAYGFVQFVTGPRLVDAQGGIAIVRRHAALFGIDDPNALKNVGGPQGVAFVQYLDNQIVARINIERYRIDRPEWRIVGHFWPHLAPAAAGTSGDPVRKRLVGGRVRVTENRNPYPCDPVSGDHRDCPPKQPPKITEWDVTEQHVFVMQRSFLVRARDGAMELRTVWYGSVNMPRPPTGQMLKGASRLVVDAVTGEDLTSRIP